MKIEIHSTEILTSGDTKFRFLVDGIYSKTMAVVNMSMLHAMKITPEAHIEKLYAEHVKNGYRLPWFKPNEVIY